MSHQDHQENGRKSGSGIGVVAALLAVFIVYIALLSMGVPQKWTQTAVGDPAHSEQTDGGQVAEEQAAATAGEHADHDDAHDGHDHADHAGHDHADHEGHDHGEETGAAHGGGTVEPPPFWMVIPFAALLLCIAILPLIPATAHWWEHNSSRFLVAASLGVVTLLYYMFLHNSPIAAHWPGGHRLAEPSAGPNFQLAWTVFENAIVGEYIAFIVLLFSLFTITGGIRISGDLKASPFTNAVIMLIGAVLASFIGTTGAAMLLIRLLLETNKQRKFKVHTVVVFIFCVCNCGGCLTPLGDPPLFLGYLRGVPFSWTFGLYVEWMFVNLILIGFYFLWDTLWFYPKESKEDKAADLAERTSLSISGWQVNVPLLFGIVASVALLDPSKTFPGTDWHPWVFFREIVQLGLVFLSLTLGSKQVRLANKFSYGAIIEVAALFFGIFICMQAPLQILHESGPTIVKTAQAKTGISENKLFFWSTGSLSSVLDNAPTYVVFFETAKTLTPNSEAELKAEVNEDGSPKWVQENGQWQSADGTIPLVKVSNGYLEHYLLVAVALGSVFMGAMTYIGNGPNFMVKAIAEESGVKMPSFFGYMVYSVLILLPILFAMTMIFLK